jgi:hypothetical protein
MPYQTYNRAGPHIFQLCFIATLLSSLTLATELPAGVGSTNLTIQFPHGTRYIAHQHLLCTPSTWKTIIPFYLADYLAHVVTVKSIPGESAVSSALALFFALMFPSLGLNRGLEAIAQCAIRGKTPLEKACRAGALAVVARENSSLWDDEETISDSGVRDTPGEKSIADAGAISPAGNDEPAGTEPGTTDSDAVLLHTQEGSLQPQAAE